MYSKFVSNQPQPESARNFHRRDTERIFLYFAFFSNTIIINQLIINKLSIIINWSNFIILPFQQLLISLLASIVCWYSVPLRSSSLLPPIMCGIKLWLGLWLFYSSLSSPIMHIFRQIMLLIIVNLIFTYIRQYK